MVRNGIEVEEEILIVRRSLRRPFGDGKIESDGKDRVGSEKEIETSIRERSVLDSNNTNYMRINTATDKIVNSDFQTRDK